MTGKCSEDRNGDTVCDKIKLDDFINTLPTDLERVTALEEYNQCKDFAESSINRRNCVENWLTKRGLRMCGPPTNSDLFIPGLASDGFPFGESEDSPYLDTPIKTILAAQCKIAIPPRGEGKITKIIDFNKTVRKADTIDDFKKEIYLPKDTKAEYKIDLKFQLKSPNAIVDSTGAYIEIFDVSTPGEGSWWNRENFSDFEISIGTTNVTPINTGYGNGFRFTLDTATITKLNNQKQINIEILYTAYNNLNENTDISFVKNTAWAHLFWDYTQSGIPGTEDFHTDGPNDASTEGEWSTVNIIRPFAEVHGGDAGFQFTENSQRVTGDVSAITGTDQTISSGNIFTEGGTDFGRFEESKVLTGLSQFEEFSGSANTNAYFNNLKQNLASTSETFMGTQFKTTQGNTGIYFIDGSDASTITGNLDMADQNKTFIIDNRQNLTISTDFKITNGYAAFIIRNGGNLIINKDITEIDGIFIVEEGEIQTSTDINTRPEQSFKQLTISGMLVGNMQNLFTHRKFIGQSITDFSNLQPNVKLLFDLRILLQTPPALEQVLGANWRQGLE